MITLEKDIPTGVLVPAISMSASGVTWASFGDGNESYGFVLI
jgi:hypothetical protein